MDMIKYYFIIYREFYKLHIFCAIIVQFLFAFNILILVISKVFGVNFIFSFFNFIICFFRLCL